MSNGKIESLFKKPRKQRKIEPPNLAWQSSAHYRAVSLFPTERLPSDIISLDLETSGLDPTTHRVVGLSFSASPGVAFYIPVHHAGHEGNANLFDIIRQLNAYDAAYEPLWVFYNAKFDMRWLERAGFIPRRWADAQILWYNLRLDQALFMRGLKESYKTLLGRDMLSLKALFKEQGIEFNNGDFGTLPVNDKLLSYACADADSTRAIFELGMVEWGASGLHSEQVLAMDHAIVKPIMRMEDAGIVLDVPMVEGLEAKLLADIEERKKALGAYVGSPHFNPASPIQVGALLYEVAKLPVYKRTKPTERHPSGQPATDSSTLKKLNRKFGARVGALRDLMEFRELDSRVRFVSRLKGGLNPNTGRIHPQYHTCRQVTGRLSSTGDGHWLKKFNFQGVPKLPKDHPHNIRKAFRAAARHQWVSIDLSNIELRLIANFSNDGALIEELNKPGSDLHRRTCEELFGKGPDDPDFDRWRKIAKICNFNLAYAFGITTLQEKIEVETGNRLSNTACQDLFDTFFEKVYAGWGQYKKDLVRDARRTFTSTTLFGRIRSLKPYYKGEMFFGCAGDRQAVNHPIQGSCADLLRKAIIDLQAFLSPDVPATLLSTVHDELNFEVEEKSLDLVVPNLIKIIEWTPPEFRVPVKCSVGVGPSWGELDDYSVVRGGGGGESHA